MRGRSQCGPKVDFEIQFAVIFVAFCALDHLLFNVIHLVVFEDFLCFVGNVFPLS